jgi:hypothetical protein
MSFPPQGAVPRRTAPPDAPPSALDRVKRLLDWKAAVVALVGLGIFVAKLQASVVTKSEFDAARREAAIEHTAMRSETRKLQDDAIERRVDLQWIGAQVAEIARVTGARVVPRTDPPPPTP